jgi:glycosyltransferase involved in cell wall biosynthesis
MHFTQQMAFFTSLPSIYHPHDLQHVHLPQYFTRRGRWARENAYRRFCKRADIVAVGTSWVKDDIVAHFGLPKEKVEVIPLAPPLDVYDPVDNATVLACATRLQLPKEFIFYPAQTWPHKNHIGLLEALALLRDRYGIAVPLVSSGRQTEFYPRIVRRATELGLFDHCRFLGFTNPTDLQCVYKLCRGVVIPTKFEAASFPLWEAFTAGAPAACANVTSLPAQAGDAALLFDPNDPGEMADVIYRLWADDALRQTLVRRGRENVERFSWDRTARTFRAHYRRLGRRPLTEEDMMLISAPPLL